MTTREKAWKAALSDAMRIRSELLEEEAQRKARQVRVLEQRLEQLEKFVRVFQTSLKSAFHLGFPSWIFAGRKALSSLSSYPFVFPTETVTARAERLVEGPLSLIQTIAAEKAGLGIGSLWADSERIVTIYYLDARPGKQAMDRSAVVPLDNPLLADKRKSDAYQGSRDRQFHQKLRVRRNKR